VYDGVAFGSKLLRVLAVAPSVRTRSRLEALPLTDRVGTPAGSFLPRNSARLPMSRGFQAVPGHHRRPCVRTVATASSSPAPLTEGAGGSTLGFQSREAATGQAPNRIEEVVVARKTVLVSDLSGEEIQEGQGAKVRIIFDDARRGALEMDVTADEAKAIGAKGRQVARRGRRPKSKA
jgi:hypothetical protein